MPEITELAEQHPELRLRPADTRAIHVHNRAAWTEELGAYEWWELSALDANGSGLVCSIHFGDAFSPAYRRNVRQIRAGRFIDAALGRKTAAVSLRVAVLALGRLAARSDLALDPRSFVEPDADAPWSIAFEGGRLAAHGEGWRLVLDAPCTTTGWRHVLQPRLAAGRRLSVQLTLAPRFHTPCYLRQFLPDSPAGALHDWLPACPCGSASGTIAWSDAVGQRRTLVLDDADGGMDHFRGSGPIGEGLRRFFTARVCWPGGAAIGELIIIRKYIQLAPSLMIFAQGEPPRIIRGDRTPRAEFQRSAWLLGYPMTLTWASERDGVAVTHAISRLADASPCRIAAVSRASVRVESASREVRLDDQPGLVQMIQPPRIDAFPWQRWCRPVPAPPGSTRRE
ncbi:MAG: hypothetical protein KJZ69_06425 [Phycisphaerales bacterium]|nr:hypothetical protein [Phycisphaerales bacterium]